MRVVVDTNVLVSAALFARSVPRKVVDVAFRRGSLLVCDRTLSELEKVLRRPRFDRIAALERRMDAYAEVYLLGEPVQVVHRIVACRDPNDDMFLEVAVNGNADYLVSGDADLLALHPFRRIPILSPADFLTAVGTSP